MNNDYLESDLKDYRTEEIKHDIYEEDLELCTGTQVYVLET